MGKSPEVVVPLTRASQSSSFVANLDFLGMAAAGGGEWRRRRLLSTKMIAVVDAVICEDRNDDLFAISRSD
jgi:hypothetical protein